MDAHLRPEVARRAASALSGYLLLGSIVNWISPSRLERFVWGPLSLVLAILCRAIASGEPPSN